MCRAVYSKLYECFVCRLTIYTEDSIRLQYVFITLQFMLPLVQNRLQQFFARGAVEVRGHPAQRLFYLVLLQICIVRKGPGRGGEDGAYCSNCMIALVGKCFYVTDIHSIIN